MRKKYTALLLVLVIFSAGCTETVVVKQTNVLYEKWESSITADDGVMLKGDLYFPRTEKARYPVVILVHQFEANRNQWNNFVPLLIAQEYAVFTYDIRGMGESKLMADGSEYVRPVNYIDTLPNDIDQILELLRNESRIDRTRVGIVGASVGANIAYYSSGTHPDIDTAVAMSPSASALTGEGVPDFNPRSVFFLSDSAEAADAGTLYARTAEPRQILVYKGTAHGVELLNTQQALDDIVFWLSKNL